MEQLANEIYEYIAQQEQPVPVKDILSHLSAKTDRRILNQILLDMAWQGDLKKTLKDGKAYYTAPEARNAKILNQLDAEITRLENMAKDMGLDLHPSNIGDTGFDMYRWTFTKGTRKSGNGWSIAIPDGFAVIESTEGRAFEAVPQGTETEKLDIQKVQLLPGKAYDFTAIQAEKWSYHLQARKGRVDAYTATMGQIMMKTVGAVTGDSTPPDGFSVVTDQVSASVLVQDTDGGSFSYQIQMLTEGKSQPLRVQTSFMTQEQKEQMTQSVTEWVKTFRFDKPNSAIPQKAPLSDPQILTNLKNGYTSAFDSAVDLAVEEAKYGLAGQLSLQKYRVEEDLAEGDGSAAMQQAMDSGMEIVAYYTRAAEKLADKLEKLPAKTMEHVYTKLQELIIRMDNLRVNGTPVRCNVPGDVQKAWEKWVYAAETAKKQERQEQEAAREKERQDQETREQLAEETIKKAEMAIYEREMKEYWVALAQFAQAEKKAKQEQDAYFQRLCNNARGNRLAEAVKKRDKIVARAESEIEHQRKRIDQAESTLSQLKFWNFKEKSEQQKILSHAKQIVSEKQAEISRAKLTYQNEYSGVESFVKANESRFLQTAKTAHPIPTKPVEPQKPVSDPTGRMSRASLQNARLARILLDRMEYGVGYTSSELAELIQDVCPGCASAKIMAILRHFPKGQIETERVKGKDVYSLA